MSTITSNQQVLNEDALYKYLVQTFTSLINICATSSSVSLSFSSVLSDVDKAAVNAALSAYNDPPLNKNGVTISANNSSGVALAANAIFTGTWEDVSIFPALRVVFTSDVVSAANGVLVQFGLLSKQADITQTYSLPTAGSSFSTLTSRLGRYFRVVYTNGPTPQTSFRLATFWSTAIDNTTLGQLGDTLTDGSNCVLSRAVLAGRHDSQLYSAVRVDESVQLRTRLPTSFDRLLTSTAVPQIQTQFTYSLNTDANVTSTTGSGTVAVASGRAQVSTGASANSSATLSSYRYCVNSHGDSVTFIVSCAFAVGVTGNTQLAGAGNATNGLFFGYNGTSFGIMTRFSGTNTWTPAASFNVDKLDGTGRSGFLLTPSYGNTYGITYDSTGGGTVHFSLMDTRTPVLVHKLWFGDSTAAAAGLTNPQLPCMVSCTNTTNTSSVTVNVTGYSCFSDSVISNKASPSRSIDFTKTVTATTNTPMIVLQNKSTFNSIANGASLQLEQLGVGAFFGGGIGNTNARIVISIIEFPTLTGATYTDVNTANSCAAVSTTATAVSGGNVLFSFCIQDGHYTFDITSKQIFVPPGAVVCVACKASIATSYATTAVLSWTEYQ